MKFSDFEHILSVKRLNRYLIACGNDTRKTMTLYRLNLNLSQEVFTLLSCFEVALRNAIDRELTARLGADWLRDSINPGGIFDIPSCRDSAKITLLGVVDTGALYRSAVGVSLKADGKYTSISLSQSFNLYGLYVDFGTGSNTPRGNPGDIGHDNKRRRRRWFSKKYYASVMNLREFYADNLGRNLANIISNALTQSTARRFTK